MNEHDFITWLRGFVETNDTPTEEQWGIIKKKLDSVFEFSPPVIPLPYEFGLWKYRREEPWSNPPHIYWTDSTGGE